jgi:hypothetical protein
MLIQTPSPGRRLQLGLNLEGPPPTPTLNPELQPIVIVDDYRTLDFQSAAYERPCAYLGSIGAVAGQYSRSVLVNPTGSGYLVRVTGLQSGPIAAVNPYHSLFLWEYSAGGGGSNFRDTRFFTPGAATNHPAACVHDSTAAGPIPGYGLGTLQGSWAGTSLIDWSSLGPWILKPGWSLGVASIVEEVALQCAWAWTERVLNAQER